VNVIAIDQRGIKGGFHLNRLLRKIVRGVVGVGNFTCMLYREVVDLKAKHFKRLTGVKKEVFAQLLDCITTYKQNNKKHASRGRPSKLSYADQLLLLLMYYREYRTQFHIGLTYGLSESRVCETIKDLEAILIKDSRFHLPGKKQLLRSENSFEVVLVDVTESPVERPKKNKEKTIQVRKSDTLKKHS
jgi:hypothetical protein